MDAPSRGTRAPFESRARRLPTLAKYQRHLEATSGWLARSFAHGRGGSCAHWTPGLGWSRPYPETTGYAIPTMIELDSVVAGFDHALLARRAGEWLLSIQNADGSWNGGLHPARRGARASAFNTGQILKGMIALHRHTGEKRWIEAAARGARWLALGVGADGTWSHNDYRSPETPSYYTHVAWPMLEVVAVTGDGFVKDAAVRCLRAIVARRRHNGVVRGWGFTPDEPAFTHTIAYTLRGLLESARLLDEWSEFGRAAVPALEVLAKKAELHGGALPGAFDDEWRGDTRFSCLAGSAQTAINLLLWERRESDLRIVNAAAKLVDSVCAEQNIDSPLDGLRGGVAGSAPSWGRYMRMRWPNWAAKYHCDALMLVLERVESELPEPPAVRRALDDVPSLVLHAASSPSSPRLRAAPSAARS
jgi:hypothetical protein